MDSCIFTNDNNVEIKLIEHNFSRQFAYRNFHEVLFRRINTFLINNNIIKDNIIDLGAWIGDNSIPWAKNIKGVVYAIDPSPENCDYIRQMCRLNNIENISVIQTAISNVNEILTTNDDLNHCSFVYGNPGKTGNNKVNAFTLDFLAKNQFIENIGYIHLDVEGMEYKILQGSINLIDKYRPVITFEQHLEIDDYTKILTLLNDKHYKVFLIDEILPGCRTDCRNSIAFPLEIFKETLIHSINEYVGNSVLVQKN